MSIIIVGSSLLVGFFLAVMSKVIINKGLHHSIHCFEVVLYLLAFIFLIQKVYNWLTLTIITYTFWRTVIRFIADCTDIEKEYKEKMKEKIGTK